MFRFGLLFCILIKLAAKFIPPRNVGSSNYRTDLETIANHMSVLGDLKAWHRVGVRPSVPPVLTKATVCI